MAEKDFPLQRRLLGCAEHPPAPGQGKGQPGRGLNSVSRDTGFLESSLTFSVNFPIRTKLESSDLDLQF